MNEVGASLEGAAEAKAWLAGIADRVEAPALTMASEFKVLEEEERAKFDALGGRYVDTGRTERSLTEPAGPDAIREVTPWGIVFGTAVPYARYLTEDEEGDRHTGGNAVLVSIAEDAVLGAGERILERIVRG